MTERISDIMGKSIHSIWLYGSVIFNDFKLGWSDIDFVALTGEPITEEQARKLLMLRQILSEEEPTNLYYRSFEKIFADINEYSQNCYSNLVYWGTSGQRITNSYDKDKFSQFELAKCGKSV